MEALQRYTIDKIQRYKSRNVYLVGFSLWKHEFIKKLINTDNEIIFFHQYKFEKAVNRAKEKNGIIFCWASNLPDRLKSLCNEFNIELVLVEDGFIRSKGLGIHLNLPASLTFSHKGVHYNCNESTELEDLLNTYQVSENNINIAINIINKIKVNKISKYNEENFSQILDVENQNKKKILVIGQVEDDASIKLGSNSIKKNLDLLKTVRHKNPDAYIMYRPHPDVSSKLRLGSIPENEVLKYADNILTSADTFQCLDLTDEVHLITSQIGIEALLMNKKVVCYGQPFYSGWGLTTDLVYNSRRKRLLTLEELIYISYILYPVYFIPSTSEPSDANTIIDLIKNPNYTWPKANKITRYGVLFKRIYRQIKRKWNYKK